MSSYLEIKKKTEISYNELISGNKKTEISYNEMIFGNKKTEITVTMS
jgi:hypothetical protein